MLYNQIWTEYMRGARGTLVSLPGSEGELSKSMRRELESDIAGLEKALKQTPGTANDLLELGSKYRQIGDVDKAIEILKRAEKLNTNSNAIQAELALCYYLNDDLDLFLEHMKKARELGYRPSKSLSDLYSQSIPKD